MSNLNEFINPSLKMIKSRVFEAIGVNSSYNTLTLEATTDYIRILTLESDGIINYTLTLDGTVPNAANTDAFQIRHNFLDLNGAGSSGGQRVSDTIMFQTPVSGGESLKIVYSGASTTWSDETGMNKKLLIEQYSY